MYEKQNKKMLIMNILNILKNHSDANHRLTQKDIIDYLKKDYDMDAERKSIVRNIENLIDEGYDINYSEVKRGTGKDKNIMKSDFYLIREFEDSELRLLIDGLIFSKYIPYSQCKDLIKKLESLSNEYFKSRTKYIQLLKDDMPANKELFYTIDVLDEAISKKKKVEFIYCNYDINKKLVPRKNDDGKDTIYKISPYYIVAANSRYYLIGWHEKYNDVSNFRLDRIKDIKIIDENIIPAENPIKNISKHMNEHIYMQSGKVEEVTFEFNKDILNDVIDWFGKNIQLKEKGKDKIEAKVSVNLEAMKYWALQYGRFIKVLKPTGLVTELRIIINDMKEKYK